MQLQSAPPPMKDSSTHFAPMRRRHRAGLMLIAIYKLLGAVLLLAVGVGALKLLHKDIDDVVWKVVADLRMNPESRIVNFIFAKAELLNDPLLKRIELAAFCYAGLGVLEALGLFFEKIWAEFLTLFITASFLPFEAHEMMRRLTWVRVSILAVNVGVVIYLLWIIGEKAAHRARRKRAMEV